MGRWLAEAAPAGRERCAHSLACSHQLFPALRHTQREPHTHTPHSHTRAHARPPPLLLLLLHTPSPPAPLQLHAQRTTHTTHTAPIPGPPPGPGMEYFMVPAQKVPPSSLQHFRKSEKEVIGGLCSLANIPLTPETQRDQERRIRREIANSNERRRMQSINAGFQSLKTLIPHTDGEKLSKAAILQQTAEYIFSLEQEKTRLLQQNAQLKRFIQEFSGSSPKRRRAEDKDEGIGSPDIWEDEKAEDLRREMIELRQQLDKERSVRMMLEEQVRSLEAHMYPEKLKVIAQQVQLQQQQEQLLPAHGPPAPTHHPTVIVPAPPPPSHHVTVVTMGPSSVINTLSTSRQNLDTIVQAIQHIEGTQEKQLLEEEEQRRRAVIVTPARASLDPSNSDTASDSEADDSDATEHSRAEMP
ncbi:transcription factor AP-4 isoform X2 [Hemicordylus capensis]|uniref:transcription factor AP-4 isoform X2 n=1 Tax=Hemicordylus capensis TaxID=884348 RepID=UPI0023039F31|nr:transcription factor AP-4 isoform X2 [Hemicordylus capensis]